MNNVNMDDYLEKGLKLPEKVIPSQELVEKWKIVLDYESIAHQHTEYIDDWYEMCHAYMRSNMWVGDPVCVDPVEEQDRMEVAANLEYLANIMELNYDLVGCDDLHHEHHNQARNNLARRKWICSTYRCKLTEYSLDEVEIIEKWIDIVKNCETLDGDYFTDPAKHDQVNMCMGLGGRIENYYKYSLFMCCWCNEGCDFHGDVWISKGRKLPRKAKEFILAYLEEDKLRMMK